MTAMHLEAARLTLEDARSEATIWLYRIKGDSTGKSQRVGTSFYRHVVKTEDGSDPPGKAGGV
jgi:hypothetical protein